MLKRLESEKHKMCLANGVYALGELCDQRNPGEKVSGSSAARVKRFLEKLSLNPERFTTQTQRYIAISLNMIRGAELTQDQKEILLKLRENASEGID